ncbi:LmbE family N-acetylglucosaminyl deacetylase/SAM-dependent methyltransferase [Lewinella aquimaris]|uniref:LmbE family N-acetylglucosaminyl deacetylase/SAM-dependent methyltransferase n=1 Tax=Neolewinella aquimaris TaxID=1835722 RepID=A0A840E1W1_9BACT|nr:bifunctional PIG-L family deacetylase/class I SAM-dependent methyltransferase [Neolewinella aquimaris]MBB4079211.1 LmbE family N-acetylglucosaminyl deacetylase/SAM-dependent methyltransferase [Neolewinella aquimaris]
MTTLPTDPALVEKRKRDLRENTPVHPVGDLEAWSSTVVFSPHPDDESLGCGGLIATLADRGQAVRVVFVSDGSMSHPNSVNFPRERRAAIRQTEALAACNELGVPADRVHFMGLPDGAIPGRHDEGFSAAVNTVANWLTEWRADTVVVPWRRDLHPDHRTTWDICRAAADKLPTEPRWIEYPIWMWEATNVVDLPRAEEMIAWRLDVTAQQDRKEAAVLAHASQLGQVIDDDPTGFVLQDHMLDHFRGTSEVYFEPAAKRHRSLGAGYFDRVYDDRDDPWNFETSAYEHGKYAATIAALPRDRYPSGFEIGCSIGVLTELLADRCDKLLSVDTSEAPLARARARLAGRPEVEFRQMIIPEEYPTASFDLVVLSEVGYYWGYEDLYRSIDLIQQGINRGGDLILVHYTPYVPDYPLTGDEVHEAFKQRLVGFHHVHGTRAERYRLDVWRRGKGTPNG